MTDPVVALSDSAADQLAASSDSDILVQKLLDTILSSLDDDQAQEIVRIDLDGKSSIADHMVIASGRSTRQVASMAQKMSERIKKAGGAARIEGLPNADWVLIDAGDVIVHLFRPEVRSFYNLERMWGFDEAAENADDSKDEVEA